MRIQALDLFYQAVMRLQMVLALCSDLALSVDRFIFGLSIETRFLSQEPKETEH